MLSINYTKICIKLKKMVNILGHVTRSIHIVNKNTKTCPITSNQFKFISNL